MSSELKGSALSGHGRAGLARHGPRGCVFGAMDQTCGLPTRVASLLINLERQHHLLDAAEKVPSGAVGGGWQRQRGTSSLRKLPVKSAQRVPDVLMDRSPSLGDPGSFTSEAPQYLPVLGARTLSTSSAQEEGDGRPGKLELDAQHTLPKDHHHLFLLPCRIGLSLVQRLGASRRTSNSER